MPDLEDHARYSTEEKAIENSRCEHLVGRELLERANHRQVEVYNVLMLLVFWAITRYVESRGTRRVLRELHDYDSEEASLVAYNCAYLVCPEVMVRRTLVDPVLVH